MPAERNAKRLGLNSEAGIALMSFAGSNLGQVAAIRDAINKDTPPVSLSAGGKQWNWDGSNRPDELAKVPLESWQILLTWQALCPSLSTPQEEFRIRNRNRAFFAQILSDQFFLPDMKNGWPNEHSKENCKPERVKAQVK